MLCRLTSTIIRLRFLIFLMTFLPLTSLYYKFLIIIIGVKRERHLSLISKVVTQIRKFLKRNNKAIVKPPPAIPKLPQLVPVRKLPPAVPKGAIRCKKYALRKCRRIKEREESLICLHEKYTKCMSRLGLPAQDFPPRPPYHVTPLLAKNS